MRRGYFGGLLTGGLAAMVLSLFMKPQYKKQRRQMMKETRQAGNKAHRVIKGVKNIADDWMK